MLLWPLHAQINLINLSSGITGTLPIGNGGTGQTTQTAAFDALSPLTTQGDLVYHNGTDNVRLAKGTGLQLLRMNSGATAPEWGSSIALAPWYFQSGDAGGYTPVDATPFYTFLNVGPLTGDPVTTAPAAQGAFTGNAFMAGTIKAVYLTIYVAGTRGSNEQGTADVRINNTTDTQILTGLKWDDATAGIGVQSYSATSLSIALAAGDWLVLKITPPTWGTNPTTSWYVCQIWATYP